MKSLSVLVADHQPLFAEGIRTVLSAPGNAVLCNITAIARNTDQVEGYLNEYRTDLLLMDPTIPIVSDTDIIVKLKSLYTHLRIVFITSTNDPLAVQRALKSGADGYLLKSASKDELRSAIREVSEGRVYVGRGVNPIPSESKVAVTNTSSLEVMFVKKYNLTKREFEIIRYIGQALTNKEIGDRLYISDQTVSVHRKNIMRKLRVNSTASLIKMVFEHHIPIAS
jgi:DNA-binding NarL/FixJ family response regulator